MHCKWIFYAIRNRIKKTRKDDDEYSSSSSSSSSNNNTVTMSSVVLPLLFFTTLWFGFAHLQQEEEDHQSSMATMMRVAGRRLLQEEPVFPESDYWPLVGYKKVIGYVIGCVSALLYLTSRIPQLIQNVYIFMKCVVVVLTCFSVSEEQLKVFHQSCSSVHFLVI